MFNYIDYLHTLTHDNRLCQEQRYKFVTCSGINALEGLLEQYQTTANFIAATDTCDESLQQRGGGWMKRRLFTVFILARHRYGDTDSYRTALDQCREIYRQFLSRHLHDCDRWANDMLYLDLTDVRSQELGATFLNGCTGLYYMLTMEEPTDISYNQEEWQQ